MKERDYKIVGYRGASGKLRAYKCTWQGVIKDRERAHLKSFDGQLDFWVDAEKLEAPPAQSERSRERAEKKTCWECGCEFTYRDAKQHDGDWQDSYCGC